MRAARPADLPVLLALQATALDSNWPALLRSAVDGPPTLLVVERSPAAVTTAVGSATPAPNVACGPTVEPGDPVGYALAVGTTDATYLAELAVAPGHRDRGHGSALLSALLARTGGECRLTIRADNEGANRLYERFGFRVRKRLPNHYDGDDGLLFVRPG
ncbi:N-acetyltransferase [Halobacteriales archaeon QS_4_69_34]|nr:MAG: N-acetyltransferase [Halobacteriales archaeon QS_4_69_34]